MNAIYRYGLPSDGSPQVVECSKSMEVIRVDLVAGEWNAWAIVDPSDKSCKYVIQRIPIPVMEKLTLSVPCYAKFIHAQDIDGLFYIWIQYRLENDGTSADRKLAFYKTGQPIDVDDLSHLIGTCKLFIMQELCLYVFEDVS